MRAHLGLGFLVLGALACESAIGLDELVFDRSGAPAGGAGGAGGATSSVTGGSGGAGGACVCGEPGCGDCPEGRVPVEVSGGPGYLIDATEVTVAEYGAFLDEGPSLAEQDSICDWNDDFTPGAWTDVGLDPQPTGCESYDVELERSLRPDDPIVCVDWCDAAAYCRARGGALCGRIQAGTVAGGIPFESSNDLPLMEDPAISAWYRACSDAGAQAYPYGDDYEAGLCNDAAAAQGEVVATESHPGCEGPSAGLFDMSGNAEEWSDECWTAPTQPGHASCARRGGAFYDSDAADLACGGRSFLARAELSNTTGFRCCSEL